MDISKKLNLFTKPAAKPAPTPQAANPVFGSNGHKNAAPADPLALFTAKLSGGQINFKPNQPALPDFAKKSWIG